MTSVSHLRTISIAGILAALGGAVLILFGVNLFLGSVAIPMSEIFRHLFSDRPEGGEALVHYNILWKSRLPEALTAAFAGAGLSVSGLQMQTVFRNPLAGPSVLGISSGASLGVALVVLLSGSLGGVALSSLGYMGEVAMNIAAAVGSLAVMGLIVFVSTKVRSHVTLLIIGVMIGYVATAVIGVFKFFSIEEDIRAYVIWGLGSFSRATDSQLSFFAILMLIFIPAGMLLVKQLTLIAGRKLRAQSGTEYSSGTAARDLFRRFAHRCRHGLLRSHRLFGDGCATLGTGYLSHIGSSDPDACYLFDRKCSGSFLQYHRSYAGV